MEIKKGCLPFLLVVACLFGFAYLLTTLINSYTTNQIEKATAAQTLSTHEFANRLAVDSTAFDKDIDKHIEITGNLLNIIYAQGHTDIEFTGGYQTDSSYQVRMPLK